MVYTCKVRQDADIPPAQEVICYHINIEAERGKTKRAIIIVFHEFARLVQNMRVN